MKLRKVTLALGIILMGTLPGVKAFAACGQYGKVKAGAHLSPQSLSGRSASFLRVNDDPDATIVGMWHATFTAQGNAAGPPDGAPIDNALVTWHSDHTELMNSARPPQDGDF